MTTRGGLSGAVTVVDEAAQRAWLETAIETSDPADRARAICLKHWLKPETPASRVAYLAEFYRLVAARAPHQWLARLTEQELRTLRAAIDDELPDQFDRPARDSG